MLAFVELTADFARQHTAFINCPRADDGAQLRRDKIHVELGVDGVIFHRWQWLQDGRARRRSADGGHIPTDALW